MTEVETSKASKVFHGDDQDKRDLDETRPGPVRLKVVPAGDSTAGGQVRTSEEVKKEEPATWMNCASSALRSHCEAK
jgi:hypothetical protein